MTLQDKVVLITGAAGMLGGAVCAAVRANGGAVFATDLAAMPGIDAAHDVTSEDDWRRVCDEIETRHGRLDGLVNNAGIVHVGSVEATELADFRRVLDINVSGVFLGCKHAWALLKKSTAASIVNVSSTAGLVGSANHAAYTASKGAVRILSKSVALHGAKLDPPIRCNSLHPSLMEGNMANILVAGAADPQAAIRAIAESRTPLRRTADPREVAESVVFLLSDRSSFMTGAELICDGGATAM